MIPGNHVWPPRVSRFLSHSKVLLKALILLVKNYRIAGNFRWVQIFAIFMDRPASARIKLQKNTSRWKLMTSLPAYVDSTRVNEMVIRYTLYVHMRCCPNNNSKLTLIQPIRWERQNALWYYRGSLHACILASSPGPTWKIGKGAWSHLQSSCMCWVSILCNNYMFYMIIW